MGIASGPRGCVVACIVKKRKKKKKKNPKLTCSHNGFSKENGQDSVTFSVSFVVVLLARTVLGSPRAAELESCWRWDQDSAPSLALHQRAGRLQERFPGSWSGCVKP